MASTYSALKIELIATGEQSGTWGTTTNNNLGNDALGEAITGSADVAFSSADVTVTLTDTNASQAARNLRLNLTGTSGGARQLILGSGCQIEKLYLINNGLADAVTVKNTSGTGIAVEAGKSTFVYNTGTNVVDAITQFNGTIALASGVSGVLPIANGGTGTSSTTFTNLASNVTGVLPIANGGTAATTLAGANIPVTTAANSFTNTQTFTGSTTAIAAVFQDAAEVTTISATAATGTINYDVTTQSVLYYTTDASGNFTVNIRGNGSTSLNTLMSTGQALTVVFLVTNGATAYYNNALTIDGSSVTPKYQGGTAFSSGNASSIDAYSYTIVKTGSAAFTVFVSQTKFA
jgi:hypothetical protein